MQPAFDRFHRYDELTAILRAFAERRPGLFRVESIGQQPRGPRHLGRRRDQPRDRRRRGQARLLGRRQHPRRRADRLHRLPVSPEDARGGLRQARGRHAPARHACPLRLPARQPRRRRMGARGQAEVHPLVHAPVPVRRGPGRRPRRRGRGRRRAHPHDAHSRSQRGLQGASGGPAPHDAARSGGIGRAVLAGDAGGEAAQFRRRRDPREPRQGGSRPQPQLPVGLAAGVPAGGRGAVPGVRARGEGGRRLHRAPPEPVPRRELPHPQRRDPPAVLERARREHAAPRTCGSTSSSARRPPSSRAIPTSRSSTTSSTTRSR